MRSGVTGTGDTKPPSMSVCGPTSTARVTSGSAQLARTARANEPSRSTTNSPVFTSVQVTCSGSFRSAKVAP